jgi:F-type H+-transporting ATPase subunit c
MDLSFGFGFSLPMALGIAALGSGIGLGRAVDGAMQAIGRQPEAAGKIQTAMIIGCALIEALTIYAFVAFFAGQGIVKMAIEAAQAVGTAAGG